MKAMVKIALLAGLIFLGACSSDSSSTPGDGNNPEGQRPKKEDIQGDLGLFRFDVSTDLEDVNSPYGLWESNTITGEAGITFTMRLRIEMNRVTAAVLCSFPNVGAVVAQADAPGEIKNNKMVVYQNMEDSSQIQKDGQIYNCTSTLSAQTENQAPSFTIVDGIMKMDGDATFVLTKIGN